MKRQPRTSTSPSRPMGDDASDGPTTPRRAITFLLPHLGPGGAERQIVTLANGFAERGWPVDIVTMFDVANFYRSELHGEVQVLRIEGAGSRGTSALRAYVDAARPQVLVCVMHLAATQALTLRIIGRLAVPIVIMEGGMLLTVARTRRRIRYAIIRLQVFLLYRWAKAIIVNAHPIADELVRVGGVPARLVKVIHNPSSTPVLEDDADADAVPLAGWPAMRAPVVATVSRMDRNKDVATLIRAFALAVRTRPLELVIIGQGEERAGLEDLARELGVGASVHFIGTFEKPWRYLRRAAVYVNSSQSEGFSNAMIEAMAVGCPIVATQSPGGTAFILDDGRLGELVPVGDPEAMAQAIHRMLDEPTDPQALIARATGFGDERIDAHLDAITAAARMDQPGRSRKA